MIEAPIIIIGLSRPLRSHGDLYPYLNRPLRGHYGSVHHYIILLAGMSCFSKKPPFLTNFNYFIVLLKTASIRNNGS